MLFSDVFLIAKTDLEIFLHNTHMRPNLMLAGCPTDDRLWCLGLYNVEQNGLEMTFLSNAEV